jgi:hypothetical protein
LLPWHHREIVSDLNLRVWTYEMPDGKLGQFQVAVKE